jgi:hypothetical protein
MTSSAPTFGNVIATLPFGLPEEPASEGLLALYDDGTIRLMPSDATRGEFEAFAGSLGNQSLAWGASLLVGLAGVGTALWFRNRRGPAWAAFTLSGLAGIGAAYLRREATTVADALTAPHALGERACLVRSRSGGIALQVREPGVPPWAVRLSADEFDEDAATTFLGAAAAIAPGAVATT